MTGARISHHDIRGRYRVEYQPGRGYAVMNPDGRMVIEPTPAEAIAQAACAQLQAQADRLARRGPRPCLCCGEVFDSEGIHNRLCDPCRAGSDALSGYGVASIGGRRVPRIARA